MRGYGDAGFRHAIHKSAIEVLYLPVSPALKKRTKVFLDTTVDNLATGLGAILVLLLTGFLGISYQHLSILSLGFVAVWGGVLYRLRASYVDAFRQALDRREIHPGEFRVQLADRSVINSLLQALRSQNIRQVVYALEMLGTVGDQGLTRDLLPLLRHRDDLVRYHALKVLQQNRSPYLTDHVLESTLTLVHHDLKHRIEVVRDYGDLPLISCYPSRLNQVFPNLLVNAAQAIEGEGTITVRTRLVDDRAEIDISDTGKGIPEANLAKIFDPGFTTKGVGIGTGLGLSICFQIMHDHGGAIRVSSIEGQGTTFTVVLPIKPRPASVS